MTYVDALPPELVPAAERVVAALRRQAERHSVAGKTPQILLAEVRFARVTDPFNGQFGYEGLWRDAGNHRCGSISFNSDGSFYAEYDLFSAHPRDARWFVEMVAAWGRGDAVSSEAKLIPAL